MRLAWASAVAFLAVACGSSGDGPSPEDTDAGPVSEASTPVFDAGLDAADDASADAAPDTADAADAGRGFCASVDAAVKFCADFDDADPGAAWTTKTDLAGISTVGIDPTTSTSAPASLRGESRALGATEPGNASLRKTILASSTHVTLAFSAKWSATTFTDGSFAVANVDVAQNRFYTLYLRDDAGNAVLEELAGATSTKTALGVVPPANVWTRVVIDLDLANGKASVSFDGTKAIDGAAITAAPATEVTIRVGNVYVTGPLPKLVGNYDDVALVY